MTRVKICGIQNENDLKNAVRAGADAVGFLVGQLHVSTHFILATTAARLAVACPPFVQPVLVTHFTDPAEVLNLVELTGIQTVQLHGGSSPVEVAVIRDRLPPTAKIIVAAQLTEDKQITDMKDFYPLADAFLLGSALPDQHIVGGTGMPCNWKLAAKFTAESPIPVILAGGLAADNAADAIAEVKPFALDANTRLKNENGYVDFDRCADFCKAVRSAG